MYSEEGKEFQGIKIVIIMVTQHECMLALANLEYKTAFRIRCADAGYYAYYLYLNARQEKVKVAQDSSYIYIFQLSLLLGKAYLSVAYHLT